MRILISIENATSDSGDHRRSYSSSFRGLLARSLAEGSIQDVGDDLTPNRVCQSITGRDESCQVSATASHSIYYLTKGESNSLQQGPDEVPRTVT